MMLQTQIPALPTGIVMSPLYDYIFGLNVLVLIAVMVWSVKEARATRSMVPILPD